MRRDSVYEKEIPIVEAGLPVSRLFLLPQTSGSHCALCRAPPDESLAAVESIVFHTHALSIFSLIAASRSILDDITSKRNDFFLRMSEWGVSTTSYNPIRILSRVSSLYTLFLL